MPNDELNAGGQHNSQAAAAGSNGANPVDRGPAPGGLGQWIVGGLTAVFVLVVVGAVVWFQPAIDPLRDQAFARGVITFVICMATIGLAFIMVFQAFFGSADDNGFRRAREVFTVLTGILGTIVGFYFGTAGTESQPPTVNGPRFALLSTGQLNVTGHIVGGKAPYQYRLSFDPKPQGEPVREGLSQDGWVEQAIAAPDKVSVIFQVTDSQGRTAEKKGDYELKKPSTPTAPPAQGTPPPTPPAKP